MPRSAAVHIRFRISVQYRRCSPDFLKESRLQSLGNMAAAIFNTDAAQEAFKAEFATSARAILTNPAGPSSSVYLSLGRVWANSLRSLETLGPDELHQPDADRDLAADLKDAVLAELDGLWSELKPKIGEVTLGKRVSSIEKHYDEAYRGALAHHAAAADRAAAWAPPAIPITPAAATSRTGQDPEAVDIIDTILQRMSPDAVGGKLMMQDQVAPVKSGNGPDTADPRAGPAVSPALDRAAKRLTGVGCPPLRCDGKIGSILALNMLTKKDSFTDYVESKKLSGSIAREALTIGRSLDLGVVSFGSRYLLSDPAEVMLRRLISVIIAQHMGHFKISQFLEELPTDSAFDGLPDSLLTSVYNRMKLELKITNSLEPKKD